MSHPESMATQSKFPVARSDFAVLERIDIIGVITSCDVAPTTKAKANVWLKDLTGKGMLLTLWGEKHVDKAQNFQAGFVLQVDNALLLKRGENNIEATAEHWLESDKHSFSWLHCDPRGEKADKLRALDTSRGKAISVPWTPSLGVGGRLSSDLSACYVACAANMCACGLAVAQGTIQAEMLAQEIGIFSLQ